MNSFPPAIYYLKKMFFLKSVSFLWLPFLFSPSPQSPLSLFPFTPPVCCHRSAPHSPGPTTSDIFSPTDQWTVFYDTILSFYPSCLFLCSASTSSSSMHGPFPLFCTLNTGVSQESHLPFPCFYSIYPSTIILADASTIMTSAIILKLRTPKLTPTKPKTHTFNCLRGISPRWFYGQFKPQISKIITINLMLPPKTFFLFPT